MLMERASKFPCAKIFYPFIFVFGNVQLLIIVNILLLSIFTTYFSLLLGANCAYAHVLSAVNGVV